MISVYYLERIREFLQLKGPISIGNAVIEMAYGCTKPSRMA
jgi:hypothetical protein